MKVMLISPMETHSVRFTREWALHGHSRGDFSPNGLMYIASYLREHSPHHEIRLVDANLLRYTQDDIKNIVMDFLPDIIGITVLSANLYDCVESVKTVKSVSKDIFVVLGGAHPTFRSTETMEYPEVDFVIKGEGEVAFCELINALEGKNDLSSIKGLAYRNKEGGLIDNDGIGYIEDLDTLPHPAFDLLPFKEYFSVIGSGIPNAVLCSSRGCPHQCTFCSKLYNSYRGRSPENIVEEMKLYYERGIREFMFFDDMFNITSERAFNISKAIRKNFADIEWSFRGRADQISEELAVELRKSNCTMVTLGGEAHTNEILKALKTGKKIEFVKRAVSFLRNNKIRVNTNWIIGLPHHTTSDDIKEMMNVVVDIDSDYAQFGILGLYDDAELFNDAVQRKLFAPDIWESYFKKPIPNFVGPSWEEHLTIEEQTRLLRYCWTRFYLRPKIIYRNLIHIKNWRMLKLKIKGFILMLVPLFYSALNITKKKKQA